MTDSHCGCHITEDEDALGYEMIMCPEHYSELLKDLDRPAEVVPEINPLFKRASLRQEDNL